MPTSSAAWSSSGPRSTPSFRATTIQSRYRSCSGRRLRSRRCSALLGASLKFEGKFILQASTDGPVDLLVADYQVPGGLRGYARFSAERLAELPPNGRLLGEGHLAMTIDRGNDTERYQGV